MSESGGVSLWEIPPDMYDLGEKINNSGEWAGAMPHF